MGVVKIVNPAIMIQANESAWILQTFCEGPILAAYGLKGSALKPFLAI
jgi:hypothetical protein